MPRISAKRWPGNIWPIWLGVLLCFPVSEVWARKPVAPAYIHVMYGCMALENNNPDVSGGDYSLTLFGLTGQVPYGGQTLQYGMEYGALLSLQSDTRSIVITGGSGSGSIKVSVDLESFILDGFFGGFVSASPFKWVRFHLAAGPLLIYGERNSQSVEPHDEPDVSTKSSALGVGLYARAGMDFIFTDRFALGFSTRGTQTSLTFSKTTGKVDVEGWQYFIAMSFRY